MKTRSTALILLVLLGVMLVSACGAGAPATESYTIEMPAATEAPAFSMEEPVAQGAGEVEAAKDGSVPPSNPGAGPVYDTGSSQDAAFAATHMIIKNGDIKLLVEDTDVAIDRATQVIGDM